MKRAADEKLPAGFESVWLDVQTKLALPTSLARVVQQDRQRREEARDDARLQLEKRASAERESKEQPPQVQQLDFDGEVPPGSYRVLPRLQAMLQATAATNLAMRTADGEVRARQAAIRKHLAQKGPDRRIARPQGWRNAIAELEAALPNFGHPIRLLGNAFALSDATQTPPRVPPMLLLGPPGVGKTHFSNRVAELMGAAHAVIAFDQPTAGSQLRGSDKYWSNSEAGLLFNLICLGDCANPVVLLDELDKSVSGTSRQHVDPLAQLHGVLEPETARRTVDISTGIEFDASLVTYIATANSLRGLDLPLVSRLEVCLIRPPDPAQAFDIARNVVNQVLDRLHLANRLRVDRKCLYVLAHLAPRMMHSTVGKAAAAAVAAGRDEIRESDLWAELGLESNRRRVH